MGRDAPPSGRPDPARPSLHRGDERSVDGRVCRDRRGDRRERGFFVCARIRAAARHPAAMCVPALGARAVLGIAADPSHGAVADDGHPRGRHSLFRHLRQGVRGDDRGGRPLGRTRIACRNLDHFALRLCAHSRAGAAVLDLHAVPARMRHALDPGAGLRRPADHRLSSQLLLQARPLPGGRRAAVGLLRSDRHAPLVGAAGNGADPDRR